VWQSLSFRHLANKMRKSVRFNHSQTHLILLECLISPPGNNSFWSELELVLLRFKKKVFYLFQCEIYEMRWPIGVKFCTMIDSRPNFIIQIQSFGGPPWKKFRGQIYAKFGAMSDNFKVRRRISPERKKVFKIGLEFLAIFGCDTHFKSELRRNH